MNRNKIIDILKKHEREMEGYSYFKSNPGVPKDEYEDVADEILALSAPADPVDIEGEARKWLEASEKSSWWTKHLNKDIHAMLAAFHRHMLSVSAPAVQVGQLSSNPLQLGDAVQSDGPRSPLYSSPEDGLRGAAPIAIANAWIPVSTILPAEDRHCYVAIKVDPRDYEGNPMISHEMYYRGNHWYDLTGEDLLDLSPNVTHWMYKSLPSPPTQAPQP